MFFHWEDNYDKRLKKCLGNKSNAWQSGKDISTERKDLKCL